MNNYEIAIQYQNSILIENSSDFLKDQNTLLVASFNAELMNLGYVLSEDAFTYLSGMPKSNILDTINNTISYLKKGLGADVVHKPMYQGFPKEVMDKSYLELYMNAIVHYWTRGHWMPASENLPREYSFEEVEFRQLRFMFPSELFGILGTLLASNDSLTSHAREAIEFMIRDNDVMSGAIYNLHIPFKENIAIVGAYAINQNKSIFPFVKTATDILRVLAHYSGGDASLSENTKFKSLPRPARKDVVKCLERFINDDDIARYSNVWIRVFHMLHIGEYKFAVKSNKIAKKIRGNKKLITIRSEYEKLVSDGQLSEALKLLSKRPGESIREIGRLERLGLTIDLDFFREILQGVSTKVILQFMGYLRMRSSDRDSRIVLPKGSVGKSIKISGLGAMESWMTLHDKCMIEIQSRSNVENKLKPVWIDDRLKRCPIPSGMRSASESLKNLTRGTRVPFGDKEVLRFFIYWVGQDIDLSVQFFNADMLLVGQNSYTAMRNSYSCHSGDITRAPNGASEFIDVRIDDAILQGVRYVLSTVYVFSGPTFKEHKEAFFGWMTRNGMGEGGDIYQPKTVDQKIDLRAESKVAVPALFDLKTREMVWIDLNAQVVGEYNNVESTRVETSDLLKSFVDLSETKLSLYGLFAMNHPNQVEDKEDAEFTFGLDQSCDITPYDVELIQSEYFK